MNADPSPIPTPQFEVEPLRALCLQTKELIDGLRGPVERIVVRAGGYSVEVRWNTGQGAGQSSGIPGHDATPALLNGVAAQTLEPPSATPATGSVKRVVAPLVGTFYRSPAPGAPPFVQVGSVVEPSQPLGIIEAMKLMNPIKADCRARVQAIHVEDATMVEFAQHLIDLVPLDH